MKEALIIILSVIVIGFMVYGSYWVAKHVSYSIFYEDMVIQTISEQVKSNALK